MAIFIHKTSDVQTTSIGSNSSIWQYVVILAGVKIGKKVNICSHCFIESNVKIGNNVTIKSGVYLWDGIIIEDNVFIGPNVTFTNDKFPRSKRKPEKFKKTILKKGSSIGAGAVILPGISIGENVMVGAGSVVTKSIRKNCTVIGNPAEILKK